jgi:hypothetical protein
VDVRTRTIAVVTLILLIAAPVFAGRTILYYENECCRNITEGEFAILYAQGLRLGEPAQGWTVQSAAATLSSLGRRPAGGWSLSRFLTEKVMSQLLINSPFYRKPFTEAWFQKSELAVTVSKARSVFPPDEGITQGEFAVLLAEALKLSPAPGGWKPESAASALAAARPISLRPPRGWNVDEILKEGDLLQILGSTHYRPVPIHPSAAVTTLQAYSILFGKFEVATEGDFGLFLVNALGATPPNGGWTKQNSLDFIKREFNVESGYGWNPGAPLCTEVFENALRRILSRAKADNGATGKPSQTPGSLDPALWVFTPNPVLQEVKAAQEKAAPINRDIEAIIRQIRKSGFIPSDRCAIIPAQGLLLLSTPPPPAPPDDPLPVSPILPPKI